LYKELILSLIVSVDTYLAAAALCNSAISIPLRSAMLINAVSAAVLGISIKISSLLGNILPAYLFHKCGAALLTAIGLLTIFKSLVRSITRKLSQNGGISLKTGKGSLVVRLYLDDTAADIDNSKMLSPPEAFALALASSLDSAATGLGSGSSGIEPMTVTAAAFICGCAALFFGSLTGRYISKLDHDLSWIGGVLLIVFAFII